LGEQVSNAYNKNGKMIVSFVSYNPPMLLGIVE
jgi:hypothetical protein